MSFFKVVSPECIGRPPPTSPSIAGRGCCSKTAGRWPRCAQRCVRWLSVGCTAQAAIRAGYSEKGANRQGFALLTNIDIQAAIQEAQSKRSDRTEITQDQVLNELAS
ncbi:terminase small subunit [Phaeobacter inhibens]|uniref:terminase small subunit n=1 Tax=Phaeobacter inhibens TaxID=221822 RepID=UPI000C99FF42|nr:terminase small subunit [Phaeobacter inhibens]